MITSYTIYRADGRVERSSIDLREQPTLHQLEALIGPITGHPMEHVRVLPLELAEAEEVGPEDYRDMFVDEMGHLRAPPKPRNEKATAIYRCNWLRAHGGDPEDIEWVAGDAVVFDRHVWF